MNYIDEAKEIAKERAEEFIYEIFSLADDLCIEREWFLEETIKQIHKQREEYE